MSNNSPKSIALRPSSSVKPVKEKYTFQPILIWKKQIALFWSLTLFWYQATQLQYLSHAALIVPDNWHQIEYFFCLLPMWLWLWRPLGSRLWLWPGRWLPVPGSVLLLELLQGGLLLPHHHRQAVLLPHHLVLLASGGKEDLARADGPGVHLTCEGGGALGGVAPWHLHHLRQPHRQHLPPLRHLHPFLFPTSTTPREVDSKRCSSQSSLGKTKDEWECDGWAGVKFTRQILQSIC